MRSSHGVEAYVRDFVPLEAGRRLAIVGDNGPLVAEIEANGAEAVVFGRAEAVPWPMAAASVDHGVALDIPRSRASQLLNELGRVVRPGGRVIVVPERGVSYQQGLGIVARWRVASPGTVRPSEWSALWARAGFSIQGSYVSLLDSRGKRFLVPLDQPHVQQQLCQYHYVPGDRWRSLLRRPLGSALLGLWHIRRSGRYVLVATREGAKADVV